MWLISIQHAAHTSKVHTNTLQSCMHLLSLATHTGQIELLAHLHSTPSSSNVTVGGSQYVICTKYEIHKKFIWDLARIDNSSTVHSFTPTIQEQAHGLIVQKKKKNIDK